MNVTEWKHRTKWLCTWKVHLLFENNPLNTTVHNMFPCQVGSSLICTVRSLIAGEFCANKNASTEKQDQIVDHGPNRVGHSIPISGCYRPWVIVSQFSTPLGLLGDQTVWNCTAEFFECWATGFKHPIKEIPRQSYGKCFALINADAHKTHLQWCFFQTNLQEYSCKKITTAKYPAKTTVNCFERKREGVLLPNVPLCKVSTHHARA